jgi:hypothetical protein
MPVSEQQRRMRALRRIVAGRDIFAWASDILGNLENLGTAPIGYRTGGARSARNGRNTLRDRAAERGSTRKP